VNDSQAQSGKLPTHKTESWFKAMRSADALELIQANRNAFILAYVIGCRARYRQGFNADGLEQGEAMLGDFKSYGMSEREYRTAKAQLTKWRFATFKTTNKGTLGKLIDTRLFDPLNISADRQNDNPPTGQRQAGDGQPTTNKKVKKENNETEDGKNTPRNFIPD
jgi:hypothetical protein